MKFKNYMSESLKTVAFWITPNGQIVGSLNTHISMVIKAPEKFGLKRDWIDTQYKNYGERTGQEGRARETIIRKLLFNGFTRIRKYGNKGYTIDVLMASKFLNKEYVTQWAKQMITKGIDGFKETSKDTNVTIIDMGRYKKKITIEELANGKLYENYNQRPATLEICKSVHEFDDFPLII